MLFFEALIPPISWTFFFCWPPRLKWVRSEAKRKHGGKLNGKIMVMKFYVGIVCCEWERWCGGERAGTQPPRGRNGWDENIVVLGVLRLLHHNFSYFHRIHYTQREQGRVRMRKLFFPSPFFASSPSSFSADAAALALRYLRNLRASLWHYLKLSFFVLFSLTRFSHHLVDLMLSCESKKKIFFTEKKNKSSEWERDDTAERKKDINYIFSHLLSPESLSLFPPLDDLSLRSQVNDDTRYEKILKVIARSATISWHCTADAHRLFLLPSFFISFHSDVKCCDVGSNGRCASVRESASIISSSRRSLKATN